MKHPWQIIESLRTKKGVSKKLLAERLGINYSYLVDLLNGRYPSKIDNQKLQIISEVFEMPVVEIIAELSGQRGSSTHPILPKKNKKTLPGQPLVSPNDLITQSAGPYPLTLLPPIPPAVTKTEAPVFLPAPIISLTPGTVFKGEPNDPVWLAAQYRLGLSDTSPQLPERLSPEQSPNWLTIPPAWGGPQDVPRYNRGVALRMTNDSLFPPFPTGSIFVVNPSGKAQIGNLVLIMVRDSRAWLMELLEVNFETIALRPYHPDYEPIMVDRPDVLFIYPVDIIIANPFIF